MGKEKITCEGGATIVKRRFNRHLQSKKHQDILKRFGNGSDSPKGDEEILFDMEDSNEESVKAISTHQLEESTDSESEEIGHMQIPDEMSESDECESEELIEMNDFYSMDGDAFDQFLYALRRNYNIADKKSIVSVFNNLIGLETRGLVKLNRSDQMVLGALLQKFYRVNRNVDPEKLRHYMQYVLDDL